MRLWLTDEALAAIEDSAKQADWSNSRDTTGWHDVRLLPKEVLGMVDEIQTRRREDNK